MDKDRLLDRENELNKLIIACNDRLAQLQHETGQVERVLMETMGQKKEITYWQQQLEQTEGGSDAGQ